mmetsp:Transcript_25720/g.75886  ORF Transcript_25720/g.75886 Transcript_25720/m.75886 type:complete len:285 (-) Transcript_25720:3636-4490(-)
MRRSHLEGGAVRGRGYLALQPGRGHRRKDQGNFSPRGRVGRWQCQAVGLAEGGGCGGGGDGGSGGSHGPLGDGLGQASVPVTGGLDVDLGSVGEDGGVGQLGALGPGAASVRIFAAAVVSSVVLAVGGLGERERAPHPTLYVLLLVIVGGRLNDGIAPPLQAAVLGQLRLGLTAAAVSPPAIAPPGEEGDDGPQPPRAVVTLHSLLGSRAGSVAASGSGRGAGGQRRRRRCGGGVWCGEGRFGQLHGLSGGDRDRSRNVIIAESIGRPRPLSVGGQKGHELRRS